MAHGSDLAWWILPTDLTLWFHLAVGGFSCRYKRQWWLGPSSCIPASDPLRVILAHSWKNIAYPHSRGQVEYLSCRSTPGKLIQGPDQENYVFCFTGSSEMADKDASLLESVLNYLRVGPWNMFISFLLCKGRPRLDGYSVP